MAVSKTPMTRKSIRPVPGFDVVCTIGRVEFDQLGEYTPFEAAMLLIARHGSDGTFEFPTASGGTHTVITESTPSPEELAAMRDGEPFEERTR
jgi:hypothetical protein